MVSFGHVPEELEELAIEDRVLVHLKAHSIFELRICLRVDVDEITLSGSGDDLELVVKGFV